MSYKSSGRKKRIFFAVSFERRAFLVPSWCCGSSLARRSRRGLIPCRWESPRLGRRCLNARLVLAISSLAGHLDPLLDYLARPMSGVILLCQQIRSEINIKISKGNSRHLHNSEHLSCVHTLRKICIFALREKLY